MHYRSGICRCLWLRREFIRVLRLAAKGLNRFLRRSTVEGQADTSFRLYGVLEPKKKERVLAMVLVHGGKGSAFISWVLRQRRFRNGDPLARIKQ